MADEHTSQLFEILSNMVCFDKFFIDYRALHAYRYGDKLLTFLERSGLDQHFYGVIFHKDAYELAEFGVNLLRGTILEKAPKRSLKATKG